MRNLYTNVPVELCKYGIVNRKINHVKLYLYLKLTSDGFIKFTNSIYEFTKDWSKELKTSSKSIKNHLAWLIENKWVTINSKTNGLRIISYHNLSSKLKLNFKSGVIYESEDFSDFEPFCYGTIVIKCRNLLRFINKQSAPKEEHANTNCYLYPKGFYPLACSYLAKYIQVSKTKAHKIITVANKSGCIEVKKSYTFLRDENGSKIPNSHFYALRKSLAIDDIQMYRRVRRGKKFLKIVSSNIIKPQSIHLKRKRLS